MRFWLYISALLAMGALATPTYASEYSDAEIDRLNDRLIPVAARVETSSAELCYAMGKHDCHVNIVMDPNAHGINAHADGHTIIVNPEMVAFAKSDTHLAFVLAHETAHQIMGHFNVQPRSQALLFLGEPPVRRNLSSIESQADYVGLYVLANAGYPVEKAIDFWGRLSHAGLNGDDNGSHPSTASRSNAMQKTALEIRAKQRQHIALLPDML